MALLIAYFKQPFINLSPPGQNGRHFENNIFKYIFTSEISSIMIRISLKFFYGQIVYKSNIASADGLAPNRRRAIIWTNADPVHWRIYAALGVGGVI